MRVIAISGGSCTGKTTVIDAIKARGYMVDDLKAARHALATLNISVADLETANESLVIRFQDELLKVKEGRDSGYSSSTYIDFDGKYVRDDIIFVERSMVDLYGFACMWHTHTSTYADWLEAYRGRISILQGVVYDTVFVLPYGKFNYSNDGVRVTDAKSGVDRLSFLDGMVKIEAFAHSRVTHVVNATSVEDRVEEILAAL
jgi:nicotinamide riboside kinase